MPYPKVKPVEVARNRWRDNLKAAVDYIRTAVDATVDEWEKNTIAAVSTWKEAITAANIENRFRDGVKRVGHAGWKKAMLEVGIGRIYSGVDAAVTKYEEAIKPYLDAIAKTELPARRARGSPANYERVVKIGTALYNLRTAPKGPR